MSPDKKTVVVYVEGHHSFEESVCLSVELRGLLEENRLEIVMDLSELESYDAPARSHEQDTFRSLRDRIVCIHFIGLSPVLRMVTAAVVLYAGIRATFHTDTDLSASIPIA
jgi:hypothetical protein